MLDFFDTEKEWRMTGGKGHPQNRRGFLLPLIILAVLAVAFFVMFVNSMGSGYSSQVAHVDEYTRCRIIGESAFATVLSRIRVNPYRDRFFAKRGYREYRTPLFGGEYDLYILDTPGGTAQADIYIESRYHRCKKIFFWRIRYENSLLDAAGKVYPLIFTACDPSQMTGNTGSPMAGFVGDLLKKRQDNRKMAAQKSAQVRSLTQTKDIISVLNGPSGGKVEEDPQRPVPVITPPPPLDPPPKAGWTTIYQENFDSAAGAVSQIPGFSVLAPGDSGKVDSAISKSSPNGFDLVNKSVIPRVEAYSVSPGDQIAFEADLMMDFAPGAKNGISGMFGFAQKGSGTAIEKLNFFSIGSEGKVEFMGSSLNPTLVHTWQQGEWFNLRIEFDFKENKANIYVNGALKFENHGVSPKEFTGVDPRTGQSVSLKCNNIAIGSISDGSRDTTLHVDNILIQQ